MQFFWKYIDDLMGKGISISVILELLFYVSASLIPLALPLAILLSSIMTFGNLAEHNELTALKSSGLSLYRIMRPLTTVVLFLAFATFYFANYVIPVAELKWHSLIYDLQNTKISALITPGVFSDKIDGYAIKVKRGENDHFEEILIHVHTDPQVIKTIRAKEGRIFKSVNGNQIFFELHKGIISEELAPQTPNFNSDGSLIQSENNSHPSRRYSFDKATYKIDISGFKLSRSNEDLFKNQQEMLNVFQLNHAIDSMQQSANEVMANFSKSIKNEHIYFQSSNFKNLSSASTGNAPIVKAADETIHLDALSKEEKIAALTNIPSNLRRINQNLEGQFTYFDALYQNVNLYFIGFHRKFALTYAIIVLFFIGAPLGAIIRKGGFGTPLVLAALLFMLYFILISVGESLATENVLSPFVGMWFASLVLTPIALILMRAAANDSQVFNKEAYIKFFNRFKRKK
jgi:lipopolysaccharide export system permease protein